MFSNVIASQKTSIYEIVMVKEGGVKKFSNFIQVECERPLTEQSQESPMKFVRNMAVIRRGRK